MIGIALQAPDPGIQGTITRSFSAVIDQITPEVPHASFVTDLAVIMIIGAVVTLAFFKIRQPLILGYLFAGMLIGPLSPLWSGLLPVGAPPDGGPGILSDVSALNLFADIGIILLLFVIGIEFPYARIKSIGKTAIGIGTLGVFATMGATLLVATSFGVGQTDALFIAAALSISSTAIIAKLLEDAGLIRKNLSILVLGVLIVEDIIAVMLITSLQSVVLAGSISVEAVAVVLVVAAGLIVGTFTIGKRVIPPLIDRMAATEHREILLLGVLGVCFGYALLANIAGLSVAIGAFLAGVLVAESRSSEVSKLLSSPIKDMFVAIFFVSVGALMDVSQIQGHVILAAALIATCVLVKLGANLAGCMLGRRGRRTSVRAAFALGPPRGEFSIVIAKSGVDIGALSAFVFPLVGVVSVVTAFMSPFLFKAGDRLAGGADGQAPREPGA